MWKRYRIWKRRLSFPLVILALLLMKAAPELSPQWFTGLAIALLLAVAYLAGEIAWMKMNKMKKPPTTKLPMRIFFGSARYSKL